MNEAILVGGSKDGTVTEYPEGLLVMNQMTFDGGDKPTSIQTYSATGLEDTEGRAVFAVTATYTDEQVDEIWELLSEDARQEILDTVAEMDEEEEQEVEAEPPAEEEESPEPEVEQSHDEPEVTNDDEKLEEEGAPVEREEESDSEEIDEDSTGEVQEDEPVEEVEEEE